MGQNEARPDFVNNKTEFPTPQFNVQLGVRENPRLHDRQVCLGNGWTIRIGRGFDIYQHLDYWLKIGTKPRVLLALRNIDRLAITSNEPEDK